MKTAVLIVCVMILAACSTFKKEPIFPLSQYEPEKAGHGLVLTMVGTPRGLPGKQQAWLETCDYTIDRKPAEPYVLFPDYVFTNCVQYGPVHHQ